MIVFGRIITLAGIDSAGFTRLRNEDGAPFRLIPVSIARKTRFCLLLYRGVITYVVGTIQIVPDSIMLSGFFFLITVRRYGGCVVRIIIQTGQPDVVNVQLRHAPVHAGSAVLPEAEEGNLRFIRPATAGIDQQVFIQSLIQTLDGLIAARMILRILDAVLAVPRTDNCRSIIPCLTGNADTGG